MGLPINSYHLFEEISQMGSEFPKKLHSLDISLYAILVHDHKNDPEFDKEVGTSFIKWHQESVNNFLFTALADPPQTWLEWAKENKEQFFGRNSDIYNPKKVYRTFNPSLTALFIAEFLGIPFNKLPVIIFTPDLNSRYFYWMPTNVGLVNPQFAWLKNIAAKLDGETLNDLPYSPFRIGRFSLEKRFSEVLVELCQKISAFQGNEGFSNSFTYSFAQSNSLEPIDRNQSEKNIELDLFYSGYKYFKKEKDHSFEDDDNSISDGVRYMMVDDDLTFRADNRGNSENERKKFERLLAFNLSLLQKESKLFLEQGIQMINSLHGQIIYDYSPFILPFVKSFEKELSYSIVHWVRKRYHISLPQYFYEFQPGIKAEVKLWRNYSIDFNQSRNDLWTSPTLGGQISGFKNTAYIANEHPFKTEEDYQQFLSFAYQIKNTRNRACHSERTTENDLDKVINSWVGLFEGGFFETLNKLKKEYRGYTD